MSATFSVKAIALAKSSNLKTLSNRLIPSFSTRDHLETLGLSSAISASVSVGSPPRHGTHFARTSSSYNGTPTRQRTVIQVSSVVRGNRLVPGAGISQEWSCFEPATLRFQLLAIGRLSGCALGAHLQRLRRLLGGSEALPG